MNNFVQKSFVKNRWIFAHALVGVYLFLITNSFIFIFIIAILWEIFEFFINGKQKIVDTYGSVSYFVYDAVGDVCAALFAAILASLLS